MKDGCMASFLCLGVFCFIPFACLPWTFCMLWILMYSYHHECTTYDCYDEGQDDDDEGFAWKM
jgi:hypothetical protein